MQEAFPYPTDQSERVGGLAASALRKVYRANQPPVLTVGRSERQTLLRSFWRFTVPRAVASVAQLALQRGDVLLVAALRPRPAPGAAGGARGRPAGAGRRLVAGGPGLARLRSQ